MVNFQKIPADILRPWVNASTTAGATAKTAAALGPTSALSGGEDLLGVAGHGDFRPHAGDALVGADQESRPHDPHELAAVHRLLLPNAIGLEHAMGFVRTERDRQLVLGLEFVLCRDRVGGDAENVRAGFGEGAFQPREVDRFLGAARRVRLRIEIKHERAAGEVRERNGSAAVARQGEGGSLCAGLKLAGHAFLSTLSQGHLSSRQYLATIRASGQGRPFRGRLGFAGGRLTVMSF